MKAHSAPVHAMVSSQCHKYLLIFSLILACSAHVFSLPALAHSPSSVRPSCPDHESSALLHFKQAFLIDCTASSSSAYPKVKSWANGLDCCLWDGVECDEETGYVIGLDLSHSCLYGTFPPNSTLFRLTHLRELSLASNHFNYSLIPFELGRLTHLRSLKLSHSAFSGQVPLEVSKLSRLSLLDLSDNVNDLIGSRLRLKDRSLERLVRNLTLLTYLDLESVDISSPVPTILTNFTSLEYLSLDDSNLRGQFPSSIFSLPRLEYLSLSINYALEGFLPEFQPSSSLRVISMAETAFSEEVPPSVGRLAHLEVLELSYSGFSGSIPSSLGNLTKLTRLDVSGNSFSGDIPLSLANLTQLETLGLSDVNLDGRQQLHSLLFNLNKLTELILTGMNLATEIPSSISNLTRLDHLYLSENQLIGQIPVWLMNQTRLKDLSLDGNHLKGPIPQEISQLVNLQSLDFSYNGGLHGNFGPILKLPFLTHLSLDGVNVAFPGDTATNKSYPKLTSLYLRSCNLAEFPQFLRSQDDLQTVNLGHNQIHGLIPQWFLNISRESLQTLSLSHNFLAAFEHPVKMLPWNYLKVLDLSGNQLQGSLPIPPTSLALYNVSNNRLVGSIPQQICHASSLEYLDISNNDLGGHIPDCISELASSLVILNLRGNNFRGIIPRSYPTSCKLKMINLCQNQLEGRIPRSLINCSMLVVLDIGQNRVNDTFPSWLGSLPNFQVLVLRHNNFHGRIMDRSNITGYFQSLRIIDLSHNFHTGDLPSEFLQIWDAMKIAKEDQSNASGTVIELDVTIAGTLMVVPDKYNYSIIITNKGHDVLYTRILSVFRVIDFSSNNFAGRIPDSIGELRGLQALNLSNNNLERRIPSSLSNIIDLESLDLSMNMLSGGIPQELTKLTFLEVFNVSYKPSGRAPSHKEGSLILLITVLSMGIQDCVEVCCPTSAEMCMNHHRRRPS